MELIAAAGLPPSVNVYTGYGVHTYWLLKELLYITDEPVRVRIKPDGGGLSRAEFIAAQRGCKLRSGAGVGARTSRTGMLNHKVPGDPKLVTFTDLGHRYTEDDLAAHFEGIGRRLTLGQGGKGFAGFAGFAAHGEVPQSHPEAAELSAGEQKSEPEADLGYATPGLDPILAGCAFIRHCKVDARTLSELSGTQRWGSWSLPRW